MVSETTFMQVLLGIIVYQIVIFLATLVADYQMFLKMGRKKWLGLIPIVNDFVLFDIFWKRPLFILYEACYWTSYILSRIRSDSTMWVNTVNLISSLIMLVLLIGLYDRIAKAFGKGFLWTIGLAVCYPLFAMILTWTTSADPCFLDMQKTDVLPNQGNVSGHLKK